MGNNATATISYGILFKDGFEFPWSVKEFGGSIEYWWRKVNGFVNPIEELWDKKGGYIPGCNKDDPRISKYFEEQRKWINENPLPIEEVYNSGGDYPDIILAIPDTIQETNCNPIVIDPNLIEPMHYNDSIVLDFCDKYGIKVPDCPRWLLSAYYG